MKRKEEMSDEEGNMEADIAVDSEYSHCSRNDPGSDFLHGVLSEKAILYEDRLYLFIKNHHSQE